MEVNNPPYEALPRRAHVRWLVTATFIILALLLLMVFSHAATSISSLILPIEALSAALAVFTVASLLAGILYSWRAYSQHRRVVAFLVAITLVTLLAHAYVIGSPPAGDQRTPVMGAVGGQLYSTDKDSANNSLLTVASSVSGQQLKVTVTASGSDAVVVQNVSVASRFTGAGFAGVATFQSPLQPGSSATGTWTAGSPVTELKVTYQSLNCYGTSARTYGCVMDEVFYIPEAMGILAGQHCTTGGENCHMEHPYLVPAMIAGGMAVFGEYNAVGWRVVPVLLGSFSIPLLFGIAWKASESKKVAYLSALLLALDVMFFSQSSGGLLDVPEVFFGLAAFFAYFAGLRFWKFDRYVMAGVLLGVAGLAKETAVFIALALLTYIVIFDTGSRGYRAYSAIKVVVIIGLVFAAGLQAYDSTLAAPTVPTFVQHVSYILSYGSTLTADKLACQPATGYWCKFANDPGGAPILPTDWLTYYSPVAYYANSVSVCPNSVNGVCHGESYSYVSLAYYGVTNLLETWTVFIWVPLVCSVLYSQFRRRQPSLEQFGFGGEVGGLASLSSETKFAAFALMFFLWSYVPYLFLFAAERVTYPFYFLPGVPAVAMGCTYWLTRNWFPKWLVAVYVAMVFVFFFIYFPEKAFLPDWLRVLIGH